MCRLDDNPSKGDFFIVGLCTVNKCFLSASSHLLLWGVTNLNYHCPYSITLLR